MKISLCVVLEERKWMAGKRKESFLSSGRGDPSKKKNLKKNQNKKKKTKKKKKGKKPTTKTPRPKPGEQKERNHLMKRIYLTNLRERGVRSTEVLHAVLVRRGEIVKDLKKKGLAFQKKADTLRKKKEKGVSIVLSIVLMEKEK